MQSWDRLDQTRRIDICAYDSPAGIGGPYVWMQRMPFELRQRGFDVRVRLFHWGPKEDGLLFRTLQKHGFEVTSQPFGNSESNVRWLLEVVAVDPPDVLIADNVIPGLLAGRYLRQWGIPTIGILRSDDTFYHGIIDRFVIGDQRDQLSAVISVSQFLTETVKKNRIGELITETIPSGTPIPAQTATAPKDVLRLVYVGRLVQEQKRIIETVNALIRLVTEIGNVHITIYGEGPERGRVEEMIVPYASTIALAGNVPSEALQKRLLETHAIVLLSDYEGTPTAIMEAMACGVVPVCLRIRSGIPELVIHEQTGLLVGDRNQEVLEAVRRLQEEPGLWQRLSIQARRHAEQNFTTTRSADLWETLLRSMPARDTTKPLTIPDGKLSLPKIHPGYAHQDVRDPGFWVRGYCCVERVCRRGRTFIGALRRKLLNVHSL